MSIGEHFRDEPKKHPKPIYPADHVVGMRVPKGGSDCAKCEYLGPNGKTCRNKGFVMWNGTDKLPDPPDEYCCDFFEAKE